METSPLSPGSSFPTLARLSGPVPYSHPEASYSVSNLRRPATGHESCFMYSNQSDRGCLSHGTSLQSSRLHHQSCFHLIYISISASPPLMCPVQCPVLPSGI